MSAEAPSSFGPGGSVLSIDSSAFTPVDSTTTWTWDFSTMARVRNGGTYPWFDAAVLLPGGAHVYHVAFEVYDGDATGDVRGFFGVSNGAPAGSGTLFSTGASTSGSPGWVYLSESVDFTVDNLSNTYLVEVNAGGEVTVPAVSFRRALIYYTLQVSAPPATPTFLDVPTDHPFFQYIEALSASGITGGCGSGNFCPGAPLTRGQMAVFLSKALGLYWPN